MYKDVGGAAETNKQCRSSQRLSICFPYLEICFPDPQIWGEEEKEHFLGELRSQEEDHTREDDVPGKWSSSAIPALK